MTTDHSNRVADHFRTDWRDYDRQIRTSIPFYDAALDLLIDIVLRSARPPAQILDLGVGTGNIASRLLAAFPDAHLTGIDLVPEFLQAASKRLEPHRRRVRLIEIDVARFDFGSRYDLVVSTFMFHHVPDVVKRMAYTRILSCLSEEGCFINADFVDSPSSHWSRIFDGLRVAFMRARGVSDERIEIQYVKHRKLELPVPLEAQLTWLAELGFADVECFWKYLNLAIFGGRKLGD